MSGLRVSGLSHSYVRSEVLSDIDLHLGQGESVALVGPSGCGKTTLLNLCAGLLDPSEGEIDNLFSTTAYVFQQARLLPWKQARENIALGLKARGIGRAKRNRCAQELGLAMGFNSEDLDKYPHELSGGMQSRVALARAFAIEPDLLLLDEPFSALDIGLKAELYALLLHQIHGHETSVLMITHDLMEAVRLAGRILVMAPEPGRIVHTLTLDTPVLERDEQFIYHTTGELMQIPVVRHSFGLPV